MHNPEKILSKNLYISERVLNVIILHPILIPNLDQPLVNYFKILSVKYIPISIPKNIDKLTEDRLAN